MNAFIGLGFLGLFFAIFGALLLPLIFFLITLQRALCKCAPQNRTMTPGLVWLQVIPFFGFIWQFFVVFAIANSLENEFRARRIQAEPKPGQNLGLAMAITRACTLIPFLGIPIGLASLVLWIIYWVKVANLSRMLDCAPAGGYQLPPYGTPPLPPYGSGYGQPEVTSGSPSAGGLQPPGYGVAHPADHGGDASATCSTCGASLPEDAVYCSACGAKTESARAV